MSDTGASTEAGGYSNSTEATSRPAGPANDQTTTYNAGMISTVAGGLSKAWGTYESGKYNKKVAEFNAEYARIQASQALAEGREMANRRELKERYIEGQTRSGFAEQDVIVGAGTSRAVMQSEATMNAADQQAIEINARRRAYGFEVTAADQDARGKFSELRGETGAISTLIDTGSEAMLEDDPSYKGSARSVRF